MNEPTNLLILKAVATYYTLQRPDLQQLCMPNSDRDGRTIRRHLSGLCHEGLLQKTNGEVIFQDRNGAPAPVYFPSKRGCQFLYETTEDPRYLSTCCYTPNWQHLYHWLGVARFHVLLDKTFAQTEVRVEHWTGEWDVKSHDAKEPENRYKLFTLIREQPRLVAAPDASWVIEYKGKRRGFYLELDRGTSGIGQIANSKTPGFSALLKSGLFGRHFPGAETIPFRVLLVTQNPVRRDELRKAIATKPGAPLWRFLSLTERVNGQVVPLTSRHLLSEPVIYSCEGEPQQLVRIQEGGRA